MKWQDFLSQKSTRYGLSEEERETLLKWFPQEHLETQSKKLMNDCLIQEDALKKRKQGIYTKFKSIYPDLGSKKGRKFCILLRQSYQNEAYQSEEQKLANLLCKLDYECQEFQFKKCLKSLEYTGAFLIRARDIKVQLLLAKQLALKAAVIRNEQPIGLFIPIVIRAGHPMTSDITDLW
ncbi:MAG: hypothetical protein WCD18_07395, partial [Thermosynechococcaceae cyanobacterium]